MTPTRTASTVTTAFATVLILAACSQGDPSSAGPAGATTSAATVAATASSSSGTTSQPSASGGASSTPSVPAGHQAITAPTVGITFAVPEDWQDLNALTEDQKALIARIQGTDPSTLSERISSTDAFYGLFSQGSRSFNSAAVAKEAETSSTPPSQANLDEFITQRGGTPTGYSTKQVPYGEAAVDTSTVSIHGIQTPGAVVAVPTSSGTYARIAVTAGSAEEVDTIVSTIVATAH